jgi:prophage regulatory protein
MIQEGTLKRFREAGHRRPGKLVGTAEIAHRLGVSRQRVRQLAATVDWPAPFETLAMGQIWLSDAVEGWIAEHRPEIAEREPSPTRLPPLGRRHGRVHRPTPEDARSGTGA